MEDEHVESQLFQRNNKQLSNFPLTLFLHVLDRRLGHWVGWNTLGRPTVQLSQLPLPNISLSIPFVKSSEIQPGNASARI